MPEHNPSRHPAFRTSLLTAMTTVTVLAASMLLGPSAAFAAPAGTGTPSGKVSGTVTSDTGTALAGMQAAAYNSAELAIGASISGTFSYAGLEDPGSALIEVYTADNVLVGKGEGLEGTYMFGGLPPGEYHVLFRSTSENHIDQWWEQASSQADATLVTVADGAEVTGISVVFAPVPEAFPTPPVPTISGTATVGQKLAGSTAAWSTTQVRYRYSWNRNGSPIAGATSQSYSLTAADAGAVLSFTVTGSKTGFTTASATSAGTTAIAEGTLAGGPPKINGTAKVGQKLTATAGSWTPSPVTLSYQWKRGTDVISGATADRYVLVAADAGRTITVSVTGSKPGFTSTTKTSLGKVIAGVLTATPTPTIGGVAQVGQKLTATAGTWAPAPVTLSYQWKRRGVVIANATKSTYTLVAADAGTAITVTVTGTKPGHPTVAKTSASSTVLKALTATPVPKITGTAKVGGTLTAVPGTWSPSGVTLTYQWKRAGVAIAKATGSTYKVISADDGQKISVTVTGTKTGYVPFYRTSASTTIVKALTAPPTPKISGTAKVGSKLTASAGTWSPAPVTLTYQWKRAGATIAKATGSSYVLVAADAGKRITVTVTGTKSGYAAYNKTSAGLTVANVLTTTPTPKITGTAKVGQTLKAVAGTWSPAPVTLKYTWLRGGTAIVGANSATYKLVASDKGRSITVKVTGSKTGFTSVSKTSAVVQGG